MRTLIESGKELPQFEAVALIDEERRPEPGLVREEPEKRRNRSAWKRLAGSLEPSCAWTD